MVFMLIETRTPEFRQYIIVPIVSMPISQSFENVSHSAVRKNRKISRFARCRSDKPQQQHQKTLLPADVQRGLSPEFVHYSPWTIRSTTIRAQHDTAERFFGLKPAEV